MFGATCAMGFPVWFSFRKGESALVIEVLATLVVLAICFALCFPLLFGHHRVRSPKQQVPQHQLKVED